MDIPIDENPRLQVGDIEIIRLTDVVEPFPSPASQMFPTVSEAEWENFHERYPDTFSGTDTWNTWINCSLVQTPTHTILVDTGLGPANTAFAQFLQNSGELSQRLQDEGVAAADIDTVFLTHLHADHVGWNTKMEDQQPRFPNAQYIAPEADWKMCQRRLETSPENAAYVQENVAPLREHGHLELVDNEIALADGVQTVHTPGHTPGHTSVKIETDGGREQDVWLLGDVAAHPLQVTTPTHHYSFDGDPGTAAETRTDIVEQVEAQNGIIGACHFPGPGFGRVDRSSNQRYWQPI